MMLHDFATHRFRLHAMIVDVSFDLGISRKRKERNSFTTSMCVYNGNESQRLVYSEMNKHEVSGHAINKKRMKRNENQ